MQDAPPHPTNPEAPSLTPPPVLLVATSDAALRVYGFGHLDLIPQQRPRPGPGQALPLPQQPPAWAQEALAAGQAGDGAVAGEGGMDEMQAAAAKAALPDDVRRCFGHEPLCYAALHAWLCAFVGRHGSEGHG